MKVILDISMDDLDNLIVGELRKIIKYSRTFKKGSLDYEDYKKWREACKVLLTHYS